MNTGHRETDRVARQIYEAIRQRGEHERATPIKSLLAPTLLERIYYRFGRRIVHRITPKKKGH